MDKKKAFKILKQKSDEIPKLKELGFGNREYILWRDDVRNVIQEAFDNSDYYEFYYADHGEFSNKKLIESMPYDVKQKDYIKNIANLETALLSVLKKHEELGVEGSGNNESIVGNVNIVPVKAFISHGKGGEALLKLENFIKELGVMTVMVEDRPNADGGVDDRLKDYLNEADFVIILATGDDVIKIKGKDIRQPSPNVIQEMGFARITHLDKVICLLEEGTVFPGNTKPQVFEPFTLESMDEAFTAIVRELRNWGFLKVGKIEEHTS